MIRTSKGPTILEMLVKDSPACWANATMSEIKGAASGVNSIADWLLRELVALAPNY